MKRSMVILFTMLLTVVLVACSSNESLNSSNTPTAPAATPSTPAATPEPEKEEVKEAPVAVNEQEIGEIVYDVVLISSGDKALEVVKNVRNETNRNLTEAKDLVDNMPSVIAEQLTLAEAEALKAKIEEAGATLELKEVAKVEKIATGIKVVLTEKGDTPLEVIKIIRNETNRGLIDSKELVDNLPSIVAQDITQEEAEALMSALEAVGATVELQ